MESLNGLDHEFAVISMRDSTCNIEEETGEAWVSKLKIYPSTAAALKESFEEWAEEMTSLASLVNFGRPNVCDETRRKAKVYSALERWTKVAKRCPEDKRVVVVAQDAENWNESFFLCFV